MPYEVITNSGSESEGRAFGLSGNLFFYPIGGAVIGIGLTLVLNAIIGLKIALVIGLVIFFLTIFYVGYLRHNRPAGFDRDWCDNLIMGRGQMYRFRPLDDPRKST